MNKDFERIRQGTKHSKDIPDFFAGLLKGEVPSKSNDYKKKYRFVLRNGKVEAEAYN